MKKCKIIISNENICIDLYEGENIAAATGRANSKHPMNGCQGGGCGICKIKILSGNYFTKKMSKTQVTDEEEKEGYALACRVFPNSDMKIDYIGIKK